MQAADLGDDGVVLRRVHDLDRLHVPVDDRHELRRGDTDGCLGWASDASGTKRIVKMLPSGVQRLL